MLGFDLATHRDEVRPRVGMLAHSNGLYEDLTVAENVRFWGATVGASAAEVDAALARMGLDGRLADVPCGGCRPASDGGPRSPAWWPAGPQVWLLDEPHAGLDAEGRDELDDMLREAAAAGATIIVASHELERAGKLATRRVDVVGGEVVSDGRRDDAWRHGDRLRSSPGRTCASSSAAAWSPTRCCRSPALVMVLFAFALDRDAGRGQRHRRTRVAPGLIWLATLFSLMVLVQRVFAVETEDGALDALRVAGVDPGGVFLGKSIALAVQLAVLEAVLLVAAVLLDGAEVRARGCRCCLSQPVLPLPPGSPSVGTLYGGLAAGVRGRETLLPLLLMPVVAPVLIGATRATEAAFGTGGTAISEGWPWLGMLAVFAAVFGAGGLWPSGP